MLLSRANTEGLGVSGDHRVRADGPRPLRFVDLFAGLGGFHQALASLGHRCVFASEIDPELQEIYWLNFGIKPRGDIRVSHEDVPPHDLLCAGFPCQPFSKAGEQRGFDCPQWGDLFDYVELILKRHQPTYILIENVPNLLMHDEGRTWRRVEERLRAIGYDVQARKMSPHMFGVPQRRERVIIVGRRPNLSSFTWPSPSHAMDQLHIADIIEEHPIDAKPLHPRYKQYLKVWQAFLDLVPADVSLSAFPIWAMEFGADYPLTGKVPLSRPLKSLAEYRGAFGAPIIASRRTVAAMKLPPYARTLSGSFPRWKRDFIQKNRDFYAEHRKLIDGWLPLIRDFPPSFQKLEWNWKAGDRKIANALVQFRASGIRVRAPSVAPSLVAITESQVPIVGWEQRYLTIRECASLQSMGGLKHLPKSEIAAFKALGNAVNVKVIEIVAKRLVI